MKSRYILFLVLAVLASSYAKGEPVDATDACVVAAHFYASKFKQAPESLTPSIVYAAPSPYGDDLPGHSFYVVNLNSDGFVIVAGDDRVKPILAFSDEGAFVAEGMPANVRFFLEEYTRGIRYEVEKKGQADEAVLRQWAELLAGTPPARKDGDVVVGPLLGNNKWNQTKYYNDLCPADATGNSAYGGHAAVGCGALVMGQVMRYWRYPVTGTGSHSYSATGYGTLSADFGATTYRYAAMPDRLIASTPDSCKEAVATLLYHCGVAVNMRYGAAASVANSNKIVSALSTYFGYPSTVRYIEKGSTSMSVWLGYLKGELDEGAPFMYGGSGSYGGHVWTCDGYRDDDYFHFNWGWGGDQNGYYALSSCSSYGFNNEHAIIIGIRGPALPGASVARCEKGGFSVFPNPTSGVVHVSSERGLTVQEFQVCDLYGRTLLRERVGQAVFSIDLSAFATGTYMLRLVAGDGVESFRILKR